MTTLAATGITGRSGRFFLKELEKHDLKGTIRCLVRKTSNTELLDISPLKNNIEKLVGDYNNYSDLLKLTVGADFEEKYDIKTVRICGSCAGGDSSGSRDACGSSDSWIEILVSKPAVEQPISRNKDDSFFNLNDERINDN